MSFIVFGPGISDHLTLNQALSPSSLPELPKAISPANAVRRVDDKEGTHSGRETEPETRKKTNKPLAPAVGAYESVRQTNKERTPVQLAEQIMSSPVFSLPPDAPISELRALCIQRNIGLVPIIDGQKKLVGIVTKGDLSRQRVRYTDLAPRAVSTIASTHVLTATTNTNIRELARVLLAQDVRGLPIVDDAGEVVGVVTRGDILRALVNYAPLELWL